jgi:uncharacterized protein (DUF2267 family)
MEGVGTDDPHLAYGALRVVLHSLRDRLPVDEAVDLAAQLPMLIRGLYYEGWRTSGKPVRAGKEEFLAAIRQHFASNVTKPDAEVLARVVLGVLVRHVSAGEMRDVRGVLPKELRELLPG